MDFTQLQYFRTVARLQNVTRAAEAMYISQPNLSTALTKLENELGIKLFYRKKGSITLTPKGELFLTYVERAMQELDNGMEAVNDRSAIVDLRTDVACSVAGLLPKLIRGFSPDQDPPPFIYLNRCSEEIYRLLMEGRLDFAISTIPSNGLDINWVPLRDDVIIALVSKDHPLAENDSIRIDDLSNAKIICNDMFLEKDAIDDLFIKAGFFPNIVLQGNELIAERELIPLRGGVALAMSHTLPLIRVMCTNDFKVIPLTGPFSTVTIGISSKKSKLLSASAQTFYKYAVDNLPDIIAETSLLK